MILLNEVQYEGLAFAGGEVGGGDGNLRAVSVPLPVNAYCPESCVAECGREACVSAAYFDVSGSLPLGHDWDPGSHEVICLWLLLR